MNRERFIPCPGPLRLAAMVLSVCLLPVASRGQVPPPPQEHDHTDPDHDHDHDESGTVPYNIGVWLPGPETQAPVIVPSWEGFVQKWRGHMEDGMRLEEIETYIEGQTRSFVGLFAPGEAGHDMGVEDSWADFVRHCRRNRSDGLFLVDVETFMEDGERKYLGLWHPGRGRYRLRAGSWEELVRRHRRWSPRGLRLVDVETFSDPEGERYIGLWRTGAGGTDLRVSEDWRSFHQLFHDLASGDSPLRLVDVESFKLDGRVRYLGLWHPGRSGDWLTVGVSRTNVIHRQRDMDSDDIRLVDLEFRDFIPGTIDDMPTHLGTLHDSSSGVPDP